MADTLTRTCFPRRPRTGLPGLLFGLLNTCRYFGAPL